VPGRLHAAAGRDRPWDLLLGQPGEQFDGARQRAHRAGAALICRRVRAAQAIDTLRRYIDAGLAQQDVREQSAAHADLAMDAPDRQRNAFAVERLLPCQHVLVDAVHQRAVEVEQECRFGARHAISFGCG